MEKIKVLIVDDHTIVREGFRNLLSSQEDIDVVGEADDGETAVKKTNELCPDLVLMDITMQNMNGIQATRMIKEMYPDVKILVLTMHEGDEFFFELLDAGASGYFIKGGSSSELIWAIRAVFKGEVFLYPTVAKKLLSEYLNRLNEGENKDSYDGLSLREREVLKLIAEGHTNAEIADILVVSQGTVHTHRSHIMEKLGLRTPFDLVKYAIQKGLVKIDD